MSQNLNSAVAVIGIDVGKNSFHVVGLDHRGAIVLRQKWSLGSKALDPIGVRREPMSALPPIATELTRRGSPPLRAKSGREQSQQSNPLFDPLVGAGE